MLCPMVTPMGEWEIRLPPLEDATPQQQLMVRTLADALAGEDVDWPADEHETWDALVRLCDQIPGALFVVFLPASTSGGGGTITRGSAVRSAS